MKRISDGLPPLRLSDSEYNQKGRSYRRDAGRQSVNNGVKCNDFGAKGGYDFASHFDEHGADVVSVAHNVRAGWQQ